MAFFQWEAALDPYDIKDYKVDYSAELTATSDELESSTFAPSPEAAAAGLEVASQSFTTTAGTAYFRIAAAKRAALDWQGEGKILTVTHTVETTDGRTLRRTIELLVQVR